MKLTRGGLVLVASRVGGKAHGTRHRETSSPPGLGRHDCRRLPIPEGERIKVVTVDHSAVHDPTTPLQHAINPSPRMSRHDEPREVGEFHPIIGDDERFGSATGSSRGRCEVVNGYFAHRSVDVGDKLRTQEAAYLKV